MARIVILTFLYLIFALSSLKAAEEKTGGNKVHWHAWTPAIFQKAKAEKKFVILDLEAVWCHWCHVMDEKTYGDAKVIDILDAKFIAVRVDQNARPDISRQYQDYGWPATIVFDTNGHEIVKRAGFIPPTQMISMLQAIIADPTPGPSVRPQAKLEYPESPALGKELFKDLQKEYLAAYDQKRGGWGFIHKFLQWNPVELALYRSAHGNKIEKKMAGETLRLNLKLVDPVWGGVYQYSAGGVWDQPHFEKIMETQTENLKIYAMAYALWNQPKHLETAKNIQRYLSNFLLSPDGAFFTSQDADLVKGTHSAAYFDLSDKQRRKKGVPKVDTHTYTRETAWAARAFATLYSVTREATDLQPAIAAADWIVKNRALTDGGFRHDEKDANGPFLGDTLAAGQLFLQLYLVTADRKWVSPAISAATFLDHNFKNVPETKGRKVSQKLEAVGYRPSKEMIADSIAPILDRDENIEVVRFTNLLHRITGKTELRTTAETAMRYLATPEIAHQLPTAGTLLASLELGGEPVHITIVGPKADAKARALFEAAVAHPSGYKRVEWWDKTEGTLPNSDFTYPELGEAAAFACSGNRCSLPIFKATDLRKKVDNLYKRAETPS